MVGELRALAKHIATAQNALSRITSVRGGYRPNRPMQVFPRAKTEHRMGVEALKVLLYDKPKSST
jgi:hypothetical protein